MVLLKVIRANMVLLQATDPIEAIRLKATRLMVFRKAQLIAPNPSQSYAASIARAP